MEILAFAEMYTAKTGHKRASGVSGTLSKIGAKSQAYLWSQVPSSLPFSWLYSPMWAFASLMNLIQSSLLFDLCSLFLILHFLISPYTQSHHLDLGLRLGQHP
jgi:hypothetical protein